MEEAVILNMKQIVDSVSVVLRYIASGFIAVLAYVFLFGIELSSFGEHSWYLVFLSASIGLITYAIHVAFLDKIFYKNSAFNLYQKSNKCVPELQEALIECDRKMGFDKFSSGFDKGKVDKDDLVFTLVSQTYRRSASENRTIKNLQRLMEQRLALLSFIYCSFYQVSVVLIYFATITLLVNGIETICKISIINFLFLFAGNVLLFVFSRAFDKRICKREIWALIEFNGSINHGKLEKKGGSSKRSKAIKTMLADADKDLNRFGEKIAKIKKTVG